MGNKLVAVAIVAMMVLTGCVVCTGNVEFSPPMTWDKLESIDATSADIVHEHSQSVTNVTGEDISAFLMLNSGMDYDQIGTTSKDWGTMAGYIGLDAGVTKQLSSTFTMKDYAQMDRNADSLRAVITNGVVTGPLFYNGQSAPIFPFTAAKDSTYTNNDSDIIRYCIYVETDYDTDADGKLDLVRVFLSVPRSAMSGEYRAPVIFIADGYDMGEVNDIKYDPTTTFDMNSLYSQPEARSAASTADSWDLAMQSSYEEWGAAKTYGTKTYGRYSVEEYDYYLVRGFAVAICSGLGSYGSEGYQLSGHELELRAHRNVIEWFDGKANAYTDTENNIATVADWCSGKVGMYGLSYLGSIALGLSMRNVSNLETVASFGAIANWYDYVYRQGININSSGTYMDWFTTENSSVFYDTERWNSISERYLEYLGTMKDQETGLNGSYDEYDCTLTSDYWSVRNYTKNAVKSDTSVLLVHGMIDFNVKSKETDIAYNTLKQLGMEFKVILNQDGHSYFSDIGADTRLDDTTGYVLLNKWYTHYLFNVNNGIENISDVMVQSNVDGSWSKYDVLKGNSTVTVKSSDTGSKTIKEDEYAINKNLDSDLMLFGKGVITVKIKTDSPDKRDVGLHVTLYDKYESGFNSYCNSAGKGYGNVVEESGIWIGAGHHVNRVSLGQKETTVSLITSGGVNLHYPGSNYDCTSVCDYDDLSDGGYRTYTIYLDPTVYTLKEGHTLQVVLSNDESSYTNTVLLDSIELVFDTMTE